MVLRRRAPPTPLRIAIPSRLMNKTHTSLVFVVVIGVLTAGLHSQRQSPARNPGPLTPVLVEAEAFEDLGGWVLDQQFMDLMGSPYLLAHGMGVPVADARTHVDFGEGGRRRVWVRTRDWVAPWKAPGAPGT